MKRRLIGFKSQYLILLGLIFMVVVMVNVGDSSATSTTNLTDHNGIVKKASSSAYNTYTTNNRTKERFKSIEDAVNSKNTINGDTIIVGQGYYNENVNINKKLILMAFGNANITAKNPDIPIITISNNGSGTVIQGFNFISNETLVSNAILLNSSNRCSILKNNFINIPGVSIEIKKSFNSNISNNNFKEGMDGLDVTNSKNIMIQGNKFSNLTLSIQMINSSCIKINNNSIVNIHGSDYLLINQCFNSTVSYNNFISTFNNPTTANIIRLIDSQNNNISFNSMKTTGTLISVEIQQSNSNQIVGNKITGSNNTGNGIQVVESNNNLINNNSISNMFSGITMNSSLKSSVMNNTISMMYEDGIHLLNCFGTNQEKNFIGHNNISHCLNGIQLDLSFHNSIYNNNISNCDNNIYSLNSECNTYYQNYLINAPIGILFKNSDDCTVVSNIITSNSADSCGIVLEDSDTMKSNLLKSSNTSTHIIVGSIQVTKLPDINVHFNRIICPLGIKNDNNKITVNAGQNWWGSNNPIFIKLVSGSVKYPNWIYMTMTIKTQRTIQGSKTAVTTSFNNLYNGKILQSFNPKLGHIPNGTSNFYITNKGKFEYNVMKKGTSNGQANTIYYATKVGKATISSTTDNQTLYRSIYVEPVLKVLDLNTTSIQRGSSNTGLIKLYFNKQINYCNGSWIELKQVSNPKKLLNFKTKIDQNHIYISPNTTLKNGVTYKLIIHSNSISDDTGNGLSAAYVKTFKL